MHDRIDSARVEALLAFNEEKALDRIEMSNGTADPWDILIVMNMVARRDLREMIIPSAIDAAAKAAAYTVIQKAQENPEGFRGQVRKHAPTLSIGVGVGTVVAAVIEALVRIAGH